MKRTNYCTKLSIKNLDEKICVCGWVNRRRDHGGLVFIDLRDRTGIL